MPSFHNADRFLATNIANFRYVKPPAENPVPSNAHQQTASPLLKNDVTIPASDESRLKPSSIVGEADKPEGVELGGLLKSFFQIFLGTAEEQKKITPSDRIRKGNSLYEKILKSCNSQRLNFDSEKFKKAVIDAFNDLAGGQKPNFLNRCKKFLDSISADANVLVSAKRHPLFQFAEKIHTLCLKDASAPQVEFATEKKMTLGRKEAFIGVVADFPEPVSDEEITRLVLGKA